MVSQLQFLCSKLIPAHAVVCEYYNVPYKSYQRVHSTEMGKKLKNGQSIVDDEHEWQPKHDYIN